MVISESMIMSQRNGTASVTGAVIPEHVGQRLNMFDYDEPTMKLSDLRKRARLFRNGIK